jgi:hypothetical protein
LRLIRQKLIVGETLGRVPSEAPTVPLQHDLTREQKRLRLPPEATQKMLDLDLRKPVDLARSRLLHRLNLLGIPGACVSASRARAEHFMNCGDGVAAGICRADNRSGRLG